MPEAPRSGKHGALRLLVCSLIMLTWASHGRAADCAPEPQGDGRIVAVIDARTVRLDDGRIIRLSGLAPLDGDEARRAAAVLSGLANGRMASLHGDSDAPDRYGRQSAWVFLEEEERSLQVALTRAGGGLRDPAAMPDECRLSLGWAETEARTAGSGLWNTPKFVRNAESPDDISADIGHFRVIEGTVRSVRQSGGTGYLNFGRRWRDGFAVMVPKRAMDTFGTAALFGRGFEGLKRLEGQRLRVRGYVMMRGGPRIEVLSPNQIEVIGGDAVTATGKQD